MDDRIQELLERARETAATAGEYAGQMVDTARLRGRLFALRTDINGLLHTAGRLVYDAHRGGAGGEDALEQVFSELDRKEAAAAELPEVADFVEEFLPSFGSTLDQLLG